MKDPESGTELAEVDSSKNSVVSKLKAELVNKEAELDGLRLRLKSQESPQE